LKIKELSNFISLMFLKKLMLLFSFNFFDHDGICFYIRLYSKDIV